MLYSPSTGSVATVSNTVLVNNGVPLTSAPTLDSTYLGNIIPCNGLFNITVPLDSIIGASNGSSLSLLQLGTSVNNFVQGSGVTLIGTPPPNAQNIIIGLMWISSNTWLYI
jgi:hypothetical protein